MRRYSAAPSPDRLKRENPHNSSTPTPSRTASTSRLIAGSQGLDGSEDRTEIESFQKIIAHGSAAGAGPASFSVISKNGATSIYGTAPGSTETDNNGAVVVWKLSQLSDLNSNHIDYVYSDLSSPLKE